MARWGGQMDTGYIDRELDNFISEKIMEDMGKRSYSPNIAFAWQVVEKMMRKYFCELWLDVFLGVTGEHWVASFYNPRQLKRYEASGATAPLAICRAAQSAYIDLVGAGSRNS